MSFALVTKALSRAIEKANPIFATETGIHGRELAGNGSPPDFPPTYYVTIRPRLGGKGPTAMFIITSAGRAMWARVHRTAEGCSYQFR
ncbi:MAG TPA: hypothetical protein PK867_21210, partial [Pirellulales bacterium]|nr:hypothetical protein [Pirellulales bacterium]